VQNGTISLKVTPYVGTYDGQEHNALSNISVEPSDAKLEYSLDGENYVTEMPKIKDTSEFTVTVVAGKEGYKTVSTTETIKVNRAEGKLTLSSYSGTLTYPNSTSFTINENTTNISITSSNTNIATASLNGNTVTVKPGTTAGKVTITVTTEENTVTKDVRTMEYNMLTLPINLTIGDYVDIRITFPDGQDFIVIAKKEIKNIQGNTVTFDMSEADIVMLNSAIVESYIMKASNIYIAKYVEPGMQEKAANTYVPTAEVIRLIETDSNIVSTAKNELTSRFDANIRSQMNSTVNQYSEQGLTNVEEGIQKQIEDAKKAREEYLSSLAQ